MSSLQLGSKEKPLACVQEVTTMVSEVTSMMMVAIVEGQGGFHRMGIPWDCLLAVVIVQGREYMDNSCTTKNSPCLSWC